MVPKKPKITIEVRYFQLVNQENNLSVSVDDGIISSPSNDSKVSKYDNHKVRIERIEVPFPTTYTELQTSVALNFKLDRLFICERENGERVLPYEKSFQENEVLIFREFQPSTLRLNLNMKKVATTWERDSYNPFT